MILAFTDRAAPPSDAHLPAGAPSTGDAPVDGAFAATLAGFETDPPAESGVQGRADPLARADWFLSWGLSFEVLHERVALPLPDAGQFADGPEGGPHDGRHVTGADTGDDTGADHPVDDETRAADMAACDVPANPLVATPLLTPELRVPVTDPAVDAGSVDSLDRTGLTEFGSVPISAWQHAARDTPVPAVEPPAPAVREPGTRDSALDLRQSPAARLASGDDPVVTGAHHDMSEGLLTSRPAPSQTADSASLHAFPDVPARGKAAASTRATHVTAFHQPAAEVRNAVPAASEQTPGDLSIARAAVIAAVIPVAFVRADQAQSGAVAGPAAIDLVAAVTAGDDPHAEDPPAQGDGRRSHEFARFVAALSLNGPSRPEDGGHAPAAFALPRLPEVMGTMLVSGASVAHAVSPGASFVSTDAENIDRLVQAMRIHARPGVWEATVRLKPEHLGEVTISLRVERNVVSAVVEAEAAGVRQWLESQEQAVRSGLATHGLHLDRFVVHRDGERSGRDTPEQDSRRRPPRRAPLGAERFEIIV